MTTDEFGQHTSTSFLSKTLMVCMSVAKIIKLIPPFLHYISHKIKHSTTLFIIKKCNMPLKI